MGIMARRRQNEVLAAQKAATEKEKPVEAKQAPKQDEKKRVKHGSNHPRTN